MENASKALIMAGGVLIGLMILGALILMFNSLTNYQATNTQNTRDAQVIQFNNQYETYNRTDVRGSELYSLLNRAVDYNERKSEVGTVGAEIAYKQITITVNFNGQASKFSAPDGTNRLFKNDTYTIDTNKNTFENMVNAQINSIETNYGSGYLTNITTALTKIFIEETSSDSKKQEAVNIFNSISKKVKANSWSDIGKNSEIRKDVYTYYEFVQFKRAHFDCTLAEYDQNTGRIIKMEFKFNGTIE